MNRLASAINSNVYPRLPIFAQNAACSMGGWLRYRARFNQHFQGPIARNRPSLVGNFPASWHVSYRPGHSRAVDRGSPR